ncbi:MAG TPA: hypothetical protein VE198_14380 [Actinoallomurus sp.]|jgi:hypothetical protein|nr:hypothetical protein [Actinoallomurus sp.]
MTANGNGTPQDPAENAAQAREDLGKTAEGQAAKADDLKGRAKAKAVQTKEAVAEHQAVRTAQDKATQAKEKATQAKDKVAQAKSDLVSRARESDAVPTEMSPATRRAGVGAAATGAAAALTVWLLRRRARRNANPWNTAARSAKAQIKTVRRQAKSGLKTARKRSRAQAAAQVAAAKARAHKAKAKAKSRG